LKVFWTQPITRVLQLSRVVTGGEAVGKFGVAEAVSGRSTLGPLMPVEPNFGWVGEVATDLDEAQPERGVADVEVKNGDSAIGLVEAKLGCAGQGRSGVAHEDLLDFLSYDDGDYSGLAGFVDAFADVIDLAIIPAGAIRRVEAQHRDTVYLGEATHGIAEAIANGLNSAGEGIGLPRCWVK